MVIDFVVSAVGYESYAYAKNVVRNTSLVVSKQTSWPLASDLSVRQVDFLSDCQFPSEHVTNAGQTIEIFSKIAGVMEFT